MSASTSTKQNLIRRSELFQHCSEGNAWMVIHNKVYDVSTWKNHPGGELIKQGYGRDATSLYESTHPDSAVQVLNKFYIGEIHPEDRFDKYTFDSEFYKTLRARVNDWFAKNNIKNRQDHWELYAKMALVTICWPLFHYLALTTSSVFLRFVFALLSAFFVSHFGISVMHDGCHGAFSKNPKITALAAHYLDFIGASSFVWKHQHNIGHHSHTNTPEDPDAVTAHPMIRVSPHRDWKPWMQFQQYYAWVLFCFVVLRWMQKDIEVVVDGKYDENIPLMKFDRKQKIIFIMSKIWMLFIFILAPIYCLGLKDGLIFFFFLQTIVSLQFALQFTVNHYESPLVFPSASFPVTDWATLQVETTSNYGAGNIVWEYWSGGLNYQIEHHLFPSIAHPYYRHLCPIVQQTCKEFGVKYQNYSSFFEAVGGVFDHLKQWGTKPASLK